MQLNGILSGKKTYVTAAIAVVTAIALYLTGEDTLGQAMQLGMSALMAAFIRHGIATS